MAQKAVQKLERPTVAAQGSQGGWHDLVDFVIGVSVCRQSRKSVRKISAQIRLGD